MTWFKIDDGFHSHPKVIAAGNAAIGLWARCGAWSSDHLTDGFVPTAIARMYGSQAEAKALVREGLWHTEHGGYRFHDFHDFNPAAEKVKAERTAATERQRRHRERGSESRRDNERDEQRDTERDSAVTSAAPSPSRPRPGLSVVTDPSSSSKDSPSGPDDDDRFTAAVEIVVHGKALRTKPRSPKAWKRTCRTNTIDEDGDTLRRELAEHGDPVQAAAAVLGSVTSARLAAEGIGIEVTWPA